MRFSFALMIILGLLIGFSCPAPAGDSVPFKGTFDPVRGRLFFSLGAQSGLAVTAERGAADQLRILADVRHWQLAGMDILTTVQADLSVSGGEDIWSGALSGSVTSRMTLVNSRPVRDLDLRFKIKDRRLIIERLWLGSLLVHGALDLSAEAKTDLSCDLFATDLDGLSRIISGNNGFTAPEMSGSLSGAVTLSGDLFSPVIKGRMTANDGYFGSLVFDSITFQFEGTYPVVVLRDSVVLQNEGVSFTVSGPLDLSDLSHLSTQLARLKKEPIISEDKDGRSWVFKRLRSQKDTVTEMKYFISKDDRGDVSAVVGFQRKVGF